MSLGLAGLLVGALVVAGGTLLAGPVGAVIGGFLMGLAAGGGVIEGAKAGFAAGLLGWVPLAALIALASFAVGGPLGILLAGIAGAVSLFFFVAVALLAAFGGAIGGLVRGLLGA